MAPAYSARTQAVFVAGTQRRWGIPPLKSQLSFFEAAYINFAFGSAARLRSVRNSTLPAFAVSCVHAIFERKCSLKSLCRALPELREIPDHFRTSGLARLLFGQVLAPRFSRPGNCSASSWRGTRGHRAPAIYFFVLRHLLFRADLYPPGNRYCEHLGERFLISP
jgi:hypothetical protein